MGDELINVKDLLDTSKATVIVGGAGLVASAVSSVSAADVTPTAMTDDDEAGTNWLVLLVQQAKDAYRGRNPRAVSKLWGSDSIHDCSTLDGYDSLSLHPGTYDKLGSSHCGVPRAGFVAVGGDVSNVELGSGVLFHYCNIVVCRDAEDNHHFIRLTAS